MSITLTREAGDRHMPQLDGLRTLAVSLVFLHHWTELGRGLGIIGVQLFFVLSGFLITGILLRLCASVESGRQSVAFSLRQFYARRFLRIFPLYYACLLLFVAMNRFGIRETAPWHFLYLSNVLFFLQGHFGGSFSHFWSLAVEEQFYLFWPLVVLLTPRARLPWMLGVMILIGPLTRAGIFLSGGEHFAQHSTLLPANLDTLGLGALAAWWVTERGGIPTVVKRAAPWLVVLGFAEMVAARMPAGGSVIVLLDSLAVAVVSVWLVLSAARGFHGWAGAILENPVMVYLGRISYGLYVWHMFAPAFLRNVLKAAHLPEAWNQGVIGFTLSFVGTVAVASVSWFLIERPLNDLKRRFPYQRPVPASAQAVPVKSMAAS